MSKAVLLAIIIGLVVVVAAGILLVTVFLSGDKPSVIDSDDDFDFTIAETEAPPEETQAPPEETQAPPEETQAPPEETPPPPDTGYPALVGVWSSRKWDEPVAGLSESYAQRAYDTDPVDSAALLALIEDIRKDMSESQYVYFYVFREDGTGYYLGIFEGGHMYTTYNYHVDGDILNSTNMVTNTENIPPDWTLDEQPDHAENPFRIVVSDGQERLYILPDFPEESEYAGITMDEFMNSPVAEYYFMIKIM